MAYDPRSCQVGGVILVRGVALGDPSWDRLLGRKPAVQKVRLERMGCIASRRTVTMAPGDA